MNALSEVCANPEATRLSELYGCIDYSHVTSFNWPEIITLIAAALLGAVLAPLARKNAVAILDGLFLCPLAALGGMIGGLLLAQWIHPYAMGVFLGFSALAGLFFLIRGLVVGNGDAGWKALGVLGILAAVAAYVLIAIAAFSVPAEDAREAYSLYLNAMTWLFTLAAFFSAFMASAYGAYHGVAGWFLALVNGSWGALGNLLAVGHHISSWSFFASHGTPRDGNRRFYFYYNDGMRFRNRFAFTVGAVVTGPVEDHESHHVLQHFIFGPIFTLSYLLWMIPGAIVGLIYGPAKGRTALQGIEACAYYNNPWENWAYAVEGAQSQNGDTTLIWGNKVSWTVSILYIAASSALYPTILYLWMTA